MSSLSIHLLMDIYGDAVSFLTVVNSPAVNIGVHVSILIRVIFGCIPRSEIAKSYGSSVFGFLRNLHPILHNHFTSWYSHQQCRRNPYFHNLSSEIVIFHFSKEEKKMVAEHTTVSQLLRRPKLNKITGRQDICNFKFIISNHWPESKVLNPLVKKHKFSKSESLLLFCTLVHLYHFNCYHMIFLFLCLTFLTQYDNV